MWGSDLSDEEDLKNLTLRYEGMETGCASCPWYFARIPAAGKRCTWRCRMPAVSLPRCSPRLTMRGSRLCAKAQAPARNISPVMAGTLITWSACSGPEGHLFPGGQGGASRVEVESLASCSARRTRRAPIYTWVTSLGLLQACA